MSSELEQLKSVLRSLVVSCPTQMDMRALLRDYRGIMGEMLPIAQYGYRDAYAFLSERCKDCFLLNGPRSNPVLTLIVPDSLKHIDQHVQKQRLPSSAKGRCKRRSVPSRTENIKDDGWTFPRLKQNSNNKPSTHNYSSAAQMFTAPTRNKPDHSNSIGEVNQGTSSKVVNKQHEMGRGGQEWSASRELVAGDGHRGVGDGGSSPNSTDHSDSSSARRSALDEINEQIVDIVRQHPQGLWSADLVRLYREARGRELPLAALGHRSATALLVTLPGVRVTRPPHAGDWHVALPGAAPPPSAPPASPARRAAAAADPGDALPGLDCEEAVFPRDCVQWAESVPRAAVDVEPGDMVAVCVAEVYSPAHVWLQRLKTQPSLHALMDDMMEYYGRGAGAGRRLSEGAARAGHYCAALFEGDWHRAVLLAANADTLTVRYIDYGTVERVPRDSVRPLLRRYAEAMPQQAVRARLGGVRPAGGAGAQWAPAAAQRLLALVRDRRLVANVADVDPQERILEVILVDTSTEEDVNLNEELILSGHAARRSDSALLSLEAYLRPSFDALESGAAPALGDLLACARAGLSLMHVSAHERHVQPQRAYHLLERALRRAAPPAPPPPAPRRSRSEPRARPAPPAPRPPRACSHPRSPPRRAPRPAPTPRPRQDRLQFAITATHLHAKVSELIDRLPATPPPEPPRDPPSPPRDRPSPPRDPPSHPRDPPSPPRDRPSPTRDSPSPPRNPPSPPRDPPSPSRDPPSVTIAAVSRRTEFKNESPAPAASSFHGSGAPHHRIAAPHYGSAVSFHHGAASPNYPAPFTLPVAMNTPYPHYVSAYFPPVVPCAHAVFGARYAAAGAGAGGAGAVKEGPARAVCEFEVALFRAACATDAATGARHMARVLALGAAPAGAARMLPALDADVFLRLAALDAPMAARHLLRALDRAPLVPRAPPTPAPAPARPALNPEAHEFRRVSHHMQTEPAPPRAPAPPAAAHYAPPPRVPLLRPPPGFEHL